MHKINIRKPNILLLGLLFISILYAESKKYIVLDDVIGLSLEKTENEQLKIFPIENFSNAKFYQVSDSLFSIIYFENVNDSLIIYINPYQEYLIKSRIKDYKKRRLNKTSSIIRDSLPVYNSKVFNIKFADPIVVLKYSGEELNNFFHSVSPIYLRVYSDEAIERIALKDVKEIIYFNKDIEYKKFRVYFYTVFSLAGGIIFDRFGEITGYSLSSKWIYRSAGIGIGFYCGYCLYQVIDRNLIKKIIYCNDGTKFKKCEAWLKRKLDFIKEKLQIGGEVNIY